MLSCGDSAYEPFKSRISVLYSTLNLLNISPIVYQSQMFWGLSFSAGPKGWGAWSGAWTPCFSGRRSVFVRPLPIVGHSTKCGFLGENTSLPLHPVLMWSFYPSLLKSYLASFQAFFRGNYSMCSGKFGVSMGGGEFRLFLCCHLEPLLLLIYF